MPNQATKSSLLTVKQVEQRLNVSRKTIWDLRKKGKLTAVLLQDCVRFTEDEIERFITESSESQQG